MRHTTSAVLGAAALIGLCLAGPGASQALAGPGDSQGGTIPSVVVHAPPSIDYLAETIEIWVHAHVMSAMEDSLLLYVGETQISYEVEVHEVTEVEPGSWDCQWIIRADLSALQGEELLITGEALNDDDKTTYSDTVAAIVGPAAAVRAPASVASGAIELSVEVHAGPMTGLLGDALTLLVGQDELSYDVLSHEIVEAVPGHWVCAWTVAVDTSDYRGEQLDIVGQVVSADDELTYWDTATASIEN